MQFHFTHLKLWINSSFRAHIPLDADTARGSSGPFIPYNSLVLEGSIHFNFYSVCGPRVMKHCRNAAVVRLRQELSWVSWVSHLNFSAINTLSIRCRGCTRNHLNITRYC